MLGAILGRNSAQCYVGEKQVPLVTLIIQQSIAFSNVWCSPSCVKIIKNVLDVSRLPKEHPFYIETMKRFQYIRPGQKLEASTFNQENAKIKEVIADIKQNGSKYTELELNDVNDELLEAIGSICTSLKTLTIRQRNGSIDVTDKGLFALTKLSKINTFTLDGVFPYMSEEGLKKLLSSKHFVFQVKDLNIHSLLITDAIYNIVMSYKSLQILSLHSYYLTPAIATFFPPQSLKGFKLEQTPGFAPSPFSDMLVSVLANYRLTTLQLKGEASITEDVLCACLQKQMMLLALDLDLQPLTPKVLDSIPANIFRLNLAQLEGIVDFKPFFSKQNKAIELHLHQAAHLTVEDLSVLKAPVKSLLLDAPLLRAIPQFITLEEFTIKNNPLLESESFQKLNNLTSLTVLSVINCPRFDSNVLESFYRSSLRHQLRRLELVKVGVSDLMPLTEFGNLRSIALRKCFNVNATNLCNFLGSTALQTTVKGLYLDSLVLKKIHLMLLCEFGYLVALYIGNPNYLTEAEKEDALELPNLLTNNAIVYIWNGGSQIDEYNQAYSLVKQGTDPK